MNNLPSKIDKVEASNFYKNDDGIVYVSSLYVAGITGKENKIVMRDIRNIINSDKDFTEYNFVLSQYKDNSGKMNDFYWMTEDGCSVLIGGYSIVHRIKVQKELRAYKEGNQDKLPKTFGDALILAGEYHKKLEKLKETYNNIVNKNNKLVEGLKEYTENDITAYNIKNEFWFRVRDITDKLGLKHVQGVLQRVEDCDKKKHIDEAGKKHDVVNIKGLNKIIITSRTDTANDFRKMITEDLLPSIDELDEYENNQKLLK